MSIGMFAFMAFSAAMSAAANGGEEKAAELKRLSALTDDEINTMFAGEPGAAPLTDASGPPVAEGVLPGLEAVPPPAVPSVGSSLGGQTPSTPAAVPGGGRDFTTVVPPIPATDLAATDAANAATDLTDAGGKGGGTGPAAVGQMLMGLAQIAASSQREPPKGAVPFQGQAPGVVSPFARQGGVRQQPGQGIRTMQDFFQGLV